jgi:hypothetical protein
MAVSRYVEKKGMELTCSWYLSKQEFFQAKNARLVHTEMNQVARLSLSELTAESGI